MNYSELFTAALVDIVVIINKIIPSAFGSDSCLYSHLSPIDGLQPPRPELIFKIALSPHASIHTFWNFTEV